jgi:hypothetical protein
MKRTILLVLTTLFWHPEPGLPQSGRATGSECAVVEQALNAYRAVRPGSKRREVERSFRYDGGLQFPDHGRYTYRGCEYIKLEIDFKLAPDRGNAGSSPDDTVAAVSRLFIDYPTRD